MCKYTTLVQEIKDRWHSKLKRDEKKENISDLSRQNMCIVVNLTRVIQGTVSQHKTDLLFLTRMDSSRFKKEFLQVWNYIL